MRSVNYLYEEPALIADKALCCTIPKGSMLVYVYCLLVVLFLTPFRVGATSSTQSTVIFFAPSVLLDSANRAYSKGNFEKASEFYEKIISLGYASPEIYFNLGNTYYKLDKIGMSILNYERAKKLSPQDADINFNLKLANQKTLDKIEPAPQLFLEEWWNNFKSMHTERTWGITSIACFILFLLFLGLFITTKNILHKQIGFWLSLAFCVFAISTFFIAKSRYHDMTDQNTAVILSSSAEIKNSPADEGAKLFILHEGTKVAADEIQGDWVKIELNPEKVGWVKKTAIEYI